MVELLQWGTSRIETPKGACDSNMNKQAVDCSEPLFEIAKILCTVSLILFTKYDKSKAAKRGRAHVQSGSQ